MVILTSLAGIVHRCFSACLILPGLAVVLLVGRMLAHSQRYWRFVLRAMTPVILAVNQVRLDSKPYDPAIVSDITDGVFQCLSCVDILVLNRIIPDKMRAYYPPIACPFWLVIIFEKCGYMPLRFAESDIDSAMIGVVPPAYTIGQAWPDALPEWLAQPCTRTLLIKTTSDITTDFRSLWSVSPRDKQVITVSVSVHTWPAIINTRQRDRVLMRHLAAAWS